MLILNNFLAYSAYKGHIISVCLMIVISSNLHHANEMLIGSRVTLCHNSTVLCFIPIDGVAIVYTVPIQ